VNRTFDQFVRRLEKSGIEHTLLRSMAQAYNSEEKYPISGCFGFPTSMARSSSLFPSSHDVSEIRRQPWQAAKFEFSVP
jgi:hypothetical protein